MTRSDTCTEEFDSALCGWCREPHGQPRNFVNRAKKVGATMYCDRRCAGMARRTFVSKAQKVIDKAAYDAAYRKKNRAMLKAKKAAIFKRTYDPVKAAIERKKNMPRHVEYCRRPAYRAKKRAYDEQRRDSEYGPFAEAARLAITLNREIKSRSSNYEIRRQNQTGNKRQDRARASQEGERYRYPRTQG